MKYFCYLLLLSLSVSISCNNSSDEDPDPNTILNESDRYAICNNIIADCRNSDTGYCLMGFTWGATNPLPSSGETTGPMEPAGTLTYSFQEENGVVNTHAQINLPSKSFDNLASCAKDEIRRALETWSAVASISFEEQDENSVSDIRIYVADIRQSGIGYPNYSHESCQLLKGNLVIQADLWTNDCSTMYKFFLHEIGHVLGLGHVGSTNVMTTDFDVLDDLEGLQEGDIEGIQQLYGPK